MQTNRQFRIKHMWRKAVFISGDCQADCTAVRNSDYTLQGVRDSVLRSVERSITAAVVRVTT